MYLILVVIIIILGILLIGQINKRKADKAKYEEQDKLLTRYLADNLDME